MIPVNKDVERRWYEFEGASTYEYAHAEVKSAKISSTMLVKRHVKRLSYNCILALD